MFDVYRIIAAKTLLKVFFLHFCHNVSHSFSVFSFNLNTSSVAAVAYKCHDYMFTYLLHNYDALYLLIIFDSPRMVANNRKYIQYRIKTENNLKYFMLLNLLPILNTYMSIVKTKTYFEA